MKLLTHNFLQCHIKGVKNGYPFKIEAAQVEQRDADFDPGARSTLLPPAVSAAAAAEAVPQQPLVPSLLPQTFCAPCSSG